MGREIAQYDIPDRQLLDTHARSGVGMRRDIGEAKITHTIFGRAKVLIVRDQDKKRRVWLLTILVLTALAAVLWQGWQVAQRVQSVAPPLPLSERIRISPPTIQSDEATQLVTRQSMQSKPKPPAQTGIRIPVASRRSVPQPPVDLMPASGQVTMLPLAAQVVPASTPQAAQPATDGNQVKTQAAIRATPKMSDPIQPAAAILATPAATKSVAQSTVNRPVSVVVPGVPLTKELPPKLSPALDIQPSVPVTGQP